MIWLIILWLGVAAVLFVAGLYEPDKEYLPLSVIAILVLFWPIILIAVPFVLYRQWREKSEKDE